MKVADFSVKQLSASANCQAGFRVDLGPFAFRLRSRQTKFLTLFRDFYAEFPVLQADALVDFYIDLAPLDNHRRWIKPQVMIKLNGEQPFQPFAASYAMLLFEWGLNWCIARHAEQNLMLHAAVLERQGKALILPAPPGSGKSTLCAALAQSGWRFLSDEFCIIRAKDRQILPIPRPTPLKNQSIEIIKNLEPSVFIGPSFPNTRKGTIAHLRAPEASIAKLKNTASPAWIVFPSYQAQAKVKVQPIKKCHAFMKLATNSFNYQIQAEEGFKLIGDIIDRSACYNMSYSNLGEAIAQIEMLTHVNQ
jgi:HprK-related kinase A